MTSHADTTKQWPLKNETELRCEVPEHATLVLKLVAGSGSAEIFGIEMAPNKEYTFRDQSVAVFTWYGCVIESTGDPTIPYVADSTPMVAYVNTHIQLEARRDVALFNKERGPRVMVVGPPDHGKSMVTQVLAAYAVRLDRNPVLVDLDVGLNSLTVPGCIAAAPLDKTTLHVEEGFSNFVPLVFFHGYTTPKENSELYKELVSNLANAVNTRLDRDQEAKSAGIIVNSSGWVDGSAGLDVLLHCITALDIDVVLVMSHDKLYATLQTALQGREELTTIVKLPRSGGVISRDTSTRTRMRKAKIRDYFYGRPLPNLSVVTYSPERREGVQISSFVLLRMGGVQLTHGMQAYGGTNKQEAATKLVRVSPSADMTRSILAVLQPVDKTSGGSSSSSSESADNMQQLMYSNVAGFVSILSMDIDADKMTLLCPCPGALPSNYLLVGAIKWVD